jgi:hypothetical protein
MIGLIEREKSNEQSISLLILISIFMAKDC